MSRTDINKTDGEIPKTLGYILEWAIKQGIHLLPCERKSKKPKDVISTESVYPDKDAPDKDSFLEPTPKRIGLIERWWRSIKPERLQKLSEKDLSASIGMNYPTKDGLTVSCIDVDTDDLLTDILEVPLFKECPGVRGKKGVKLLFKLDTEQLSQEPLLQYYGSNPIHPDLEVFTKDKHAIIFGEHPESTPAHPIFYRFIRGIKSLIPVLKWTDVKESIESFTKDHNLILKQKPDKVPASRKLTERAASTQYPSTHCFPVEKFLMPTNATRNGHDIQGGHPVHGSTTGMNLTIDTQGNQWYCFRCQSGGGEMEAAAVAAGIIDCIEARPGWRTPERMSALREWLQKRGYKIPHSMFKKVIKPITILDKNRLETDALPNEFPESPVILIEAPPRSGKTHGGVLQMCKYPRANYFTHSHSVAEQATRIFREVKLASQTGVHMEGRQRCCKMEGTDCQVCPLNPYTSINRYEFAQLVEDFLIAAGVLTKENAPEDFCPFYVLREAARTATHVFTVVDYLNTIAPAEFTVLDEDTTISKFYPSSVELLEVYNWHDKASVIRKVDSIQSRFAEIKDHIKKKHKRLRQRTAASKDKASSYTILLRCIEIITQICNVCNVEANVGREEILGELSRIDYTLPDGDRFRTREMAKRIEFDLNMVNAFLPFVEPILFPFEKMRFAWIGANPASLYMIANEKKRIVEPPPGKLMIIGDTRAKLFINSLKREYSVVSVNRFSYANQFILAVVKSEKLTKGKDAIKQLIHQMNPDANSPRRVPCLVLTGSEREQEKVARYFKGLSHMSKDETRVGQMWNHAHGAINIFYQCSVISRGIDIEFYHLLFAYGTNFVNPFWYAVKKVADAEKNTEQSAHAVQVMNSVLIDETTNSILRISPTQRKNDGEPRIVFIHENDLWKVRGTVQEGMCMAAINPEQIPLKVLARAQKSFGVALQVPKGYSAKDCGLIDGSIYTNKRSDKDPEWTIDDYLKEFENSCAPAPDPLDFLPPHLITKTLQIQMKYLIRRLKMGRRDSEDALIRYTVSRLPKKSPARIKSLVAKEVVHQLVKDGYVGMENGLNGVPLLHLVKTKVEKTEAMKGRIGVEANV
jgi:hypothetical protein